MTEVHISEFCLKLLDFWLTQNLLAFMEQSQLVIIYILQSSSSSRRRYEQVTEEHISNVGSHGTKLTFNYLHLAIKFEFKEAMNK